MAMRRIARAGQQLQLMRWIEAGSRLVQQQVFLRRRTAGQLRPGTCQMDALAFAAGQTADIALRQMRSIGAG